MPVPVDKETELAIVRRAYAKQILSLVDVKDARIEAAFAQVPREHYLGPGPWQGLRFMGQYLTTPDDDPVYVYTDRLFGLICAKSVNNGQPSLHAALMADANIGVGEHVLHVGAGTGYYSAILAHIVGSAGRVTAVEFDPDLAARAATHLAHLPNVTVIAGDACTVSFEPADVIYANAAFSRVPLSWLDGLRDGGRLILPMGSRPSIGSPTEANLATFVRLYKSQVVFRVERRGDEFHVTPGVPAAFIPAEGADEASEAALTEALNKGGAKNVRRLYRGGDVPDERCWLRGEGWCFAYGAT